MHVNSQVFYGCAIFMCYFLSDKFYVEALNLYLIVLYDFSSHVILSFCKFVISWRGFFSS